MNKKVLDLNVDIIPGQSIAGFDLEMELASFLATVDYKIISGNQSEANDKSNWQVYYQSYSSPFEWDKTHLRDVFAYWGDIVTLQFDGEKEFKPLKMISVNEGCQGKFNHLIGVGDSISDFIQYYDFLFDQDCFYLASKKPMEYNIEKFLEDFDYDEGFFEMNRLNNNGDWEDRNIIEGLVLVANYRADYSLRTNDHIIESISVFKVSDSNSL